MSVQRVESFDRPKRPNGGTVYLRPSNPPRTDMTENEEGRSAPDLLTQESEPGKERELRTVRPGWWIHAYDGDEAE